MFWVTQVYFLRNFMNESIRDRIYISPVKPEGIAQKVYSLAVSHVSFVRRWQLGNDGFTSQWVWTSRIVTQVSTVIFIAARHSANRHSANWHSANRYSANRQSPNPYSVNRDWWIRKFGELAFGDSAFSEYLHSANRHSANEHSVIRYSANRHLVKRPSANWLSENLNSANVNSTKRMDTPSVTAVLFRILVN